MVSIKTIKNNPNPICKDVTLSMFNSKIEEVFNANVLIPSGSCLIIYSASSTFRARKKIHVIVTNTKVKITEKPFSNIDFFYVALRETISL